MRKIIYCLMLLCFVAFTTESCKNESSSSSSSTEKSEKKSKKNKKDKNRDYDDEEDYDEEDYDDEEYYESVEDVAAEADEMCPLDMGNGMIVNSVYVEGNYMVYEYVVDESNYNLDVMAANARSEAQRRNLLLSFMTDDMRDLVELLIDERKSLMYRYFGDVTEDCVEVKFSVSELKKVL